MYRLKEQTEQKERVLETELEVHNLVGGDVKDIVQWLADTQNKLAEPSVIRLEGTEIDDCLADNEVKFVQCLPVYDRRIQCQI